MPTPYINAVELDIVPAEYERFKAAILENAAASVKEPGCQQFDVLFEASDPHHVFLYEVYDDATALEAHRATAHFKKYWEMTAPMIAKRVAHVAYGLQHQGTIATGRAGIHSSLIVVYICSGRPESSAQHHVSSIEPKVDYFRECLLSEAKGRLPARGRPN
jgi:(4S)-4-hydroxy-5-phosphonooxypentane-2,3-dione isomerase